MSTVNVQVDDAWLAERLADGKTSEEIAAEIVDMVDAALMRSGERWLREILRVPENGRASND